MHINKILLTFMNFYATIFFIPIFGFFKVFRRSCVLLDMIYTGNRIFLPRNRQTQAIQISLFGQHDKKKNISCICLHNRVTIKGVWQHHITIFYRFNELVKILRTSSAVLQVSLYVGLQPALLQQFQKRSHLPLNLFFTFFYGIAVGYRLYALTFACRHWN